MSDAVVAREAKLAKRALSRENSSMSFRLSALIPPEAPRPAGERWGGLGLGLLCVLTSAACPRSGPEVDPKLAADGHYVAAQSAYLKGDFATAHAQFAEVRKLSPEDPRLPVAEGELFLSEANVGQALASFEEAARREPRRASTWARLGHLYSLKGDRAKAFEALGKALAVNPKDPSALETLGELELKEGKTDEAVKHYVQASESAPDSARAELVLKASGVLTKKGRGPEALQLLEDAIKRGVSSAEVLGEVGDRSVEAGDLDRAVAAYADAAKANPKDPTLLELVGELEAKRGRASEAEAAFRASLAVKDRAVVHVSLARLCQQKKSEACVKEELDRALATASGEEVREAIDLAELLVSVDRKGDALTLLNGVSQEAEQKGNTALQLRTARLAKEQGDKVALQAACQRAVASAGGRSLRCP